MAPRVRCDEQRVLALVADGLTNDQLCAELGITTRTFTRWRVARPELSARIIAARTALVTVPDCGTLAGYRRHLRRHEPTDQLCRDANTLRHRDLIDSRREALGLPPAQPGRGRPRYDIRSPETASPRPTDYHAETITERAEQAMASGRSNRWVMDAFGLTYKQVKAIRDALMDGAA